MVRLLSVKIFFRSNRIVQDAQYADVKIYHFCSGKFDKQANSCYLMGAFMITVLKQSAEQVWEHFNPYHS